MVFVLSKNKTSLAPTCEAKARILLKENRECKKNFEIKFDIIKQYNREIRDYGRGIIGDKL